MCSEVKELISLYVAGDLESSEALEVESHLAGCAPCREEAETYRTHLGNLAALASSEQPDRLPPFFWQGIQKAILTEDKAVEGAVEGGVKKDSVASAGVQPSFFRRPVFLAVAAAVLLAVSVFFFVEFLGSGDPVPRGEPTFAEPSGDGEAESQPFLPSGTPYFPEPESMAPAGAPKNPSLEL